MTTTQIFYLEIDADKRLEDRATEAGRLWARSLDLFETAQGFKRLYWGRRLEEPEKVQLHIVWSSSQQAKTFLTQPLYQDEILNGLWSKLAGAGNSHSSSPNKTNTNPPLTGIRHTALAHQVLADPFGPSLLGRPVGTALYKGTDAAWHEGAWPLWTHVVRHVDGCRGIAAGGVLEELEPSVEGKLEEGRSGEGEGGRDYLVYVAWASVRHHDDYHHTKHFRRHFVILNIGHRGYAEYGHVVFKEIRERAKGTKL